MNIWEYGHTSYTTVLVTPHPLVPHLLNGGGFIPFNWVGRDGVNKRHLDIGVTVG